MSDPIQAVLIENKGRRHWCERICSRTTSVMGVISEHVYAYRDVLTGVNYPPMFCREVREGTVRIEAVEVKCSDSAT